MAVASYLNDKYESAINLLITSQQESRYAYFPKCQIIRYSQLDNILGGKPGKIHHQKKEPLFKQHNIFQGRIDVSLKKIHIYFQLLNLLYQY